MQNKAIGIFDSGIGGLTVVKTIMDALPEENIIYLGDTARVPYGIRDNKTIKIFAAELTKYILKQKIKVLVVACNTISAICLDEVQRHSNVKVFGVINSTVSEALQSSKNKRIGVIGTTATVNSKAYEEKLKGMDKKTKVASASCPLFVPLVEEGFLNDKVSELVAHKYLDGFKKTKIDTLILGCTHYPLLKNLIQKQVGKNVKLIDSAVPVAREVKKYLEEEKLINTSKQKAKYMFLVTDAPERVLKIANIFFDNKFPGVLEKVGMFKD